MDKCFYLLWIKIENVFKSLKQYFYRNYAALYLYLFKKNFNCYSLKHLHVPILFKYQKPNNKSFVLNGCQKVSRDNRYPV